MAHTLFKSGIVGGLHIWLKLIKRGGRGGGAPIPEYNEEFTLQILRFLINRGGGSILQYNEEFTLQILRFPSSIKDP